MSDRTRFRLSTSSGDTATPSHQRRICIAVTVCFVSGFFTETVSSVPGPTYGRPRYYVRLRYPSRMLKFERS